MSATPTFLVIGAQKCGTTSLCGALGEHPEIHMFHEKETHFFSFRYDRGWDWYRSRFHPRPGEIAIGEGTPSYTCSVQYPETAERIARHLPEAKLIYMLRNPMRRIESHYVQKVSNGRKFRSFDDAVRTHRPIVDASLYWKQLNRFRANFPDERIHILFLEDYSSDPVGELGKVLRFLGVSDESSAEYADMRLNTRGEKRVDRNVLAKIRRWKHWIDITHATPKWLRSALKPWFQRPVACETRWEEETRRRVLEEVRADAESILSHCGRPAEFWDLDPRTEAAG